MKIRFTDPAAADLRATLRYIRAHSPRGARRVQARVQKIIEVVAVYPNAGMTTKRPNIRRVVISPYPYVLFYEAVDGNIIIHGIRHAARDPSTMPGSA